MAENEASVLEGKRFTVVVLLFQALFILLFGIFVEYAPGEARPATNLSLYASDPLQNTIDRVYPMFMDVHGMMFIGFGFLMAFLARYGYSSVGLNFLLGAFVLQWATLVLGFFHKDGTYDTPIQLTITNLLTADFAAAAVMITFGAVLGKVSALQLLVIAFFEIIIFGLNEMVGVLHLKAVDIGGSMFVHTFGAYFGLALSRVMASRSRQARHSGQSKEGAVYHSDLFAMIGTVILWIYWPSFNAVLGAGDQRHRAVINTYYSLSACAVTTFAVSSFFSKDGRFDMVHVQNATLAGGVAVGASADFLIEPWGAAFIGVVAGLVSVAGYRYLQPSLQTNFHIHDTCGVHNLHGMPGILGGLASVVATASLSSSKYGNSLFQIYPAMAPENGTDSHIVALNNLGYAFSAGEGRNRSTQALFQLAALVVTVIMAIAGGALTGFIVRLRVFQPLPDTDEGLFEDTLHWAVNPDQLEMKPLERVNPPAGDQENGSGARERQGTPAQASPSPAQASPSPGAGAQPVHVNPGTDQVI